jgi:hypothetical protein
MTAQEFFTLEGDSVTATAPYIIALDDGTGGGAGTTALCAFLVNDQGEMPDPGEHPDARDLNQTAYLAWAAGVMMPKLSIAVDVTGTTPSVESIIAPNRNIVAGDITVTRTGAGTYTVAVPVAKLPQKTMPPKAYCNYAGFGNASAAWTSSGLYTVYVNDNSAALDADFSIDVWGF